MTIGTAATDVFAAERVRPVPPPPDSGGLELF